MQPHPVDIECIGELEPAGALLNPLRLEILAGAREPASATEIAGRLGEPRQKVNYHVRRLARAGLLVAAEQRRKGNLIEQRYVATARSYVLTPGVIAPLSAGSESSADEQSASRLLALTCQIQTDIARALGEAREQAKRLPTLSLASEIRFISAQQRAAFTRALRDAVARVIASHTSPHRGPDGLAGPGRPYRLVVGCYPAPPAQEPVPDRSRGGLS